MLLALSLINWCEILSSGPMSISDPWITASLVIIHILRGKKSMCKWNECLILETGKGFKPWQGQSLAGKSGKSFYLDSDFVFDSFIKSEFQVIGHKYAFLKSNLFLHKIFISLVFWTETVFAHVHWNLKHHLDHNLKMQKNMWRPLCFA